MALCRGYVQLGPAAATAAEVGVADKLSAVGWSWGYCSAVTPDGWRWIIDARREGRRYIVHSAELLSAFL